MSPPRRRTPVERHVELERLFGADFLPLTRPRPGQKPAERSKQEPERRQEQGQEQRQERRQERQKEPAAHQPAVAPAGIDRQRQNQSEGGPEFAQFRTEVLACRKCGLCETRTQVVFGVGTLKAPVVFVGEAPGADEDRLGEPFVGRAGQLLTSSLAKVGVKREQVYIANILKCRPPDNRTPRPDEMAACLPYLLKQLEWIQPGRICALGNVAVQALLSTTQGISRLRGQYHDFQGRKLFATFHPAYVLRNMSMSTVFESDLRTVCRDAGLAVR